MKQPESMPLSNLDLDCLHLGRQVMAHAYRKLSAQISAQAEMIERQLLDQSAPVVLELKHQRTIRPAMARTLALIGEGPEPPKKRRYNKKPNGGPASYWAKFTPEERSAEMMRRMQKSGRAKKKSSHPRDKDHPQHAEWLAKIGKATRKRWNGLSPRQREQHVRRMSRASVAARRALKIPTVAMMKEKTA